MSDYVDVVFISGEDGDWQGMYVDGYLVDQRHSIPAVAAVSHLVGYEVGAFGDREVKESWLEDQLELPENFDDIPAEAFV